MKRFYLICTCLALLLFSATFISAVFEFTGAPSSIASLNYQTEKYQYNEAFDPSLARLDNLTRLTDYCDSLLSVKKGLSNNNINAEKELPLIASEVVRNRFYHGLSSFGFGNNYLAYMYKFGSRKGLHGAAERKPGTPEYTRNKHKKE